MGNISLFIDFTPNKKGFVTYGDSNKGVILGKYGVGNPSSTIIFGVILVEDLKHNILSISQVWDKGYKITFTNSCCIIEYNEKKYYSFKGFWGLTTSICLTWMMYH